MLTLIYLALTVVAPRGALWMPMDHITSHMSQRVAGVFQSLEERPCLYHSQTLCILPRQKPAHGEFDVPIPEGPVESPQLTHNRSEAGSRD